MDDIAIRVEHVSKTFKLPHEKNNSIKSRLINFKKRGYETQQVLKDISFEIKKGEFFGIVGRNGSGKSTLLKMLAGIYTPTEGNIQVNGKLTPFIELGVGFNPELTGRENVFLNGALLGFSRKEMAAMYQDIVEFAELEKFMDQKLKNYSSGMQVRLAFSIAIRAQTDILLIDEVLAVGDAAFQLKCFDYFERLKKEKRTVVLVSHDMGSIRRFCDAGILIGEGKIIKEGDIDEVTSTYLLLNKPKAEKVNSPKNNYEIKTVTVKQREKMVTVHVDYTMPGNAEERPVVGVSIHNQQGVYVVGFNNLYENRRNQNGRKAQSITVKIDTAQLLPNDYLVNVSLYSDNFDLLGHLNYAGAFSTGAKLIKHKDGAFDIPVEWE